MKFRREIAYNYLEGEVIIINPLIDKIICLNKYGTSLWKKAVEGENDLPEDFINLLSKYKLIEEPKTTKKLDTNIKKYIEWEEKFSPVTYGRSCGLLPAQGGPCLGFPFL